MSSGISDVQEIGTDPIWGMTHEDRVALCNASVTLDGKPAIISGTKLKFPTIHNKAGQAGQWSWPAVQRIVKDGGRFTL